MSLVRIRRRGGRVVRDCDVYIGRRMAMGGWDLPDSVWANPYPVKKHGSVAEVCRLYEIYIRGRLKKEPGLAAELEELRGKTLGCWCAPGPCHGDVLLRLLAETAASEPERGLFSDSEPEGLTGFSFDR